jgi:hypothetical protein
MSFATDCCADKHLATFRTLQPQPERQAISNSHWSVPLACCCQQATFRNPMASHCGLAVRQARHHVNDRRKLMSNPMMESAALIGLQRFDVQGTTRGELKIDGRDAPAWKLSPAPAERCALP